MEVNEMDEGYLQSKIREQADDIRELKNKVKELEIKQDCSKEKCDRISDEFIKAIDINVFKNNLLEAAKNSLLVDGKKVHNDLLKYVIKKTLQRQNEIFQAWSFSLLRVFVEKGFFSPDDGNKLERYSAEMLSELKDTEVE